RLVVRLGLVLCLASFTALGAERQKLVVMGLTSNGPGAEAGAAAIEEQLTTELGRDDRFEVIGRIEIAALLRIERQRRRLGCSEDSATCLAELSGALGAPFVVSRQLAHVDGSFRLHVKVIDNARATVRVREDAVGSSGEA